MIAEWEKQSGVLFSFPGRSGDWGHQLDAASQELANLIIATARFVPVIVICGDIEWAKKYLRFIDFSTSAGSSFPGKLLPAEVLNLVHIPTNDCWIRDFGPITTMTNGKLTLHDFRFNGWGGKFEAELDNRVSARLWASGLLGPHSMHSHSTILEGGSLETDGRGTLLTTEKCLLNRNRNPHLNKEQLSQLLKETLHINRIVWLKHGALIGDDTDAHIDTLARFCDPTTIVYTKCRDKDDLHFEELRAMEAEIKAAFPNHNLIPIPLPLAIYDDTDGHRLPATYANFLLTNGAVIVPTYGVSTDQKTVEILKTVFSEREVIASPSRALIYQHGSFHCLSCNLYS
ncbi:MAG: agmatine deiminase family protein [Bacteroidota bacterium]